jgi:hypothetical protein
MDTSNLTWVTNYPKSVKGLWPRRAFVNYIQGQPKATSKYNEHELVLQGLVGVYVDMPAEEYYELPLVKTPAELAAIEKQKRLNISA